MKIQLYKPLFLISVIYLALVLMTKAGVADFLNDFTEIVLGWVGFIFYFLVGMVAIRFFSNISVYRFQIIILLLSLSINGWYICNQQACDMAGVVVFLPMWLLFFWGIAWTFKWFLADKNRI